MGILALSITIWLVLGMISGLILEFGSSYLHKHGDITGEDRTLAKRFSILLLFGGPISAAIVIKAAIKAYL